MKTGWIGAVLGFSFPLDFQVKSSWKWFKRNDIYCKISMILIGDDNKRRATLKKQVCYGSYKPCSKWQLHTQKDTHNRCAHSAIQEMSFAIFPLLVDSMDFSIKICKFIISQKPIFTSISLCHSNSVHSLPRLVFSILFCLSLVVYTFSSLPLPKPSTQQHRCRLVSSLKANCQR